MVDRGDLGNVRLLSLRLWVFLNQTGVRRDVFGAVLDLAVHLLDFAPLLLQIRRQAFLVLKQLGAGIFVLLSQVHAFLYLRVNAFLLGL